MPYGPDYIWIDDATREYHRSRAWLDVQVREGRLSYAKFEGDRRTYLKRSELNRLIGQPAEEGKRGQAGQSAS